MDTVECRLVITETEGRISIESEIPEGARDTIAAVLATALHARAGDILRGPVLNVVEAGHAH